MKLSVLALLVAVCWDSTEAKATMTPKPTHLRASNMPMAHPFNIICYANKSIQILQNTTYTWDLFVAGNVSACPNHVNHFTIDNQTVTLNSSCLDTKEDAFLIEVQNNSAGNAHVMGGRSSIVYRVTCTPNTDGDPVVVTGMPGVSVEANASELVLPDLQIGIFAWSAKRPNIQKKNQLQSVTLGSKVQLVIYNDRGGGRMPYMLVPSKCVAYPDKQKQNVILTVLEDDTQNCTREDQLISNFNIANTTNYDLAYATLYPFKFEGHTDLPVVLECKVYICPQDDKVDGIRTGYCEKHSWKNGKRCSTPIANSYATKRRRRRDVGVGDGGVKRATLRTTFSVQEPLMSGASRCSMGILALTALMYIF